MASIIITIGREINGPFEGTRVGKARGVWMLHEEDWQAFRERVLHALTEYGTVVFAGKGHGINPFDKDSQEESACFIVVEPEVWVPSAENRLHARLAEIGKEYGQLEIGWTLGSYDPVKVS